MLETTQFKRETWARQILLDARRLDKATRSQEEKDMGVPIDILIKAIMSNAGKYLASL